MPKKIFTQELEGTRRRGRHREKWKEEVEYINWERISWLGHLQRIEEDRMPQKDLHSRTRGVEKKGKTQEKMERGSRKRSSSAGSEKMERAGGR